MSFRPKILVVLRLRQKPTIATKSKSYADGALQLTLTEMPLYVVSTGACALKSLLRLPEGYAPES
jgi:hypothetical protein